MTRADAEMVRRADGWAHLTAARFYPPTHPLFDDAKQAALLKLVDALARFDPDRIAWRTYAIMVMRRALIDFKEYHDRRATTQTDRPPDPPAADPVDPSEVLDGLPRLYRRALLAGGRAAPLGLPPRAAARVIECSKRELGRILDDRPWPESR